MEIHEIERLPSLYGSEITQQHCVGYCCYHHCYITVKQVQTKKCLYKQCDALKRYPHEYWRQRELKKNNKKKNGGFVNDK